MKRILAAVLGLITALLFCACQPTPEKAVVVQKDSERLLEDAQKDTANSPETSADVSLQEQYAIPETYQFEAQGADGLLNIHVDAQVVVPGTSAMPIYRVKKAQFSQGVVTALFGTLCGDAEMYVRSWERTKEQIQEEILQIKKGISEENQQFLDNGGLSGSEENIAMLEKQLKTAPETIVEERADGILREISEVQPVPDPGIEAGAEEPEETPPPETITYLGLDAYERYEEGINGTGRSINVQNRDNLAVIFYTDFRNPGGGVNFSSSGTVAILDDTDIDAEIQSEIGLAPSEAEQMVQELLDKTGSEMVVDSIYLQDDEQKGSYDGIVRPAEQYAYKVYCVRTVDGLPCSYVAGGSEPADGDMMAPYWMYESLHCQVNSEGIFDILWMCPLEIIETVNEDAQLKPFSEIQEIFEKMMGIKYEPQAEYGGSEYDFEINRVTLSLHRVVEQDSNETGLLVPAWNFYGKLLMNASGEEYEKFEKLGESFMTINAIDGSIIDTQKGY